MTKFAVEGGALMVRFTLGEMTVTHRRTLRIPLSLVHSVSVDPNPWGWLLQRVKTGNPPYPEAFDRAADHAVSGPSMSRPDVPYFEGGLTYVRGDIVRLVGSPGAQVFVRVNPSHAALQVDLTRAVPYIGFLVAHRDPATAAADLRAAIGQAG